MNDNHQKPPRHARGFTLVESLAAMAVVGIVATTALPSLSTVVATRRLDGAASQLAADLQFARSEAVMRRQPVRLTLQGDASGNRCYVLHTGDADACSCEGQQPARCSGEAQALKTVSLPQADGITLQASANSLMFDPVHGTVSPTATLRVTGRDGRAVHQVVNLMGRVRTCSPTAAVSGYRAC